MLDIIQKLNRFCHLLLQTITVPKFFRSLSGKEEMLKTALMGNKLKIFIL